MGWDFSSFAGPPDPGMEPAPGFPEEVSFASIVGWFGLLQREETGKEPQVLAGGSRVVPILVAAQALDLGVTPLTS